MNNPAPSSEVLLEPSLYDSADSEQFSNEGWASLLQARWRIVLLAWIVRLSAGINLYSSLLHHRPKLVYWLAPWVPFEISEGRRILLVLTAILLFYLASALTRGKRMAWLLLIVALTVAPALHLGRETLWPQLMVNGCVIGFLLLHRRYFVAASDPWSIRSALVICPLLALSLLVFGTLRLYELRDETSGNDDLWACAQTACELVLVQNTHTQAALTDRTVHFFSFLRVGGTSIALVGLFLTLQPVLARRRGREEHRDKAQILIEQYGHDPFDAYAMLPDKNYFFTANGRAVVPYALSGNIAVALADPIGQPATRPRAIEEFALFCRRQDWEPVFYAVTDEMSEDYRKAEFSLFKIGEGARLRADHFHLQGRDFQNLRTICNGARKRGLQFRWYSAADPEDPVLERQLALISRAWIEVKNVPEMSFDMGAFSLEDIRQNGAAVAVDSSGAALAFATWRSFDRGHGRALDLMRHLPGVRNIMDFILVESILRFRSHGVNEISLGLAPLANTEASPSHLVVEEKVVQFLFENLNHIYGYKSLFEFKRKYRPTWHGHYVAYRRGVHLPRVGLALANVHAPQGIYKLIIGGASRSSSQNHLGNVFPTVSDVCS
jgi:phosphatidylglycerol lysyltransferase